jgi:hypothetical protein
VVTALEALAALLGTDTDRTRHIWRDGQPALRHTTHVHMCWTPRELKGTQHVERIS